MKAIRRSLDERLGYLMDKAGEKVKKLTPWAVGLGAAAMIATGSILPARKVEATPTFERGEISIQTPSQTAFTSLEDVVNSPQPTEQVKEVQPWTSTDKYGNYKIMDNDDIVLHLGVPPSDVDEIIWRRNGVPLEFVNPEDKVTILTNALMKTFDGNYLEHSPASSHTDHAIAGYEYTADVFLKNGDMKRISTTVESTFKWHPKEVWAEMDNNWTDSMEELSYNDMIEFFKELKNDGFTGISFDMAYYMMTPYDNKVFELETVDPKISTWNMRTPSQAELEEMLKAISEVGLDAHVRGNIYISKEYQDAHGFAWSSLIDPTNPQKFFDNYTKLWLKLVPLLNKYHVKLITPFTEMDGIEKYPDLIKKMYTKISERYEGEMGFEEATGNILSGTSPFNFTPIHTERAYANFERNFTFWDWKDSSGRSIITEHSVFAVHIENQKDQRVSYMLSSFVKFMKPAVDYYKSTYPDVHQMFGELGIYNIDGVGEGPSVWDSSEKRMDFQEMADITYVHLKGAKELGIESINIWSIPLGDLWPNDVVGNFFINTGLRSPESPAYRVITSIIGPNTSTSE